MYIEFAQQRITMTKSLMICPFCDEERAFTYQGMTQHVRARHPDKSQELKDNKAMYLEKYACDEAGNPIATPAPKETPTEPPKPEPKPEPKETPAVEVMPPKTPEKKEKKEKPAEGGLFPGIRKLIREL